MHVWFVELLLGNMNSHPRKAALVGRGGMLAAIVCEGVSFIQEVECVTRSHDTVSRRLDAILKECEIHS